MKKFISTVTIVIFILTAFTQYVTANTGLNDMKYKFIVLMDISGTMRAEDEKYEQSIPFTALKMFADTLTLFENSEAAFIYFAADIENPDDSEFKNIKDNIEDIKSNMNKDLYVNENKDFEGTNISLALKKADELINKDSGLNTQYTVLLISDCYEQEVSTSTAEQTVDNWASKDNVFFQCLRWNTQSDNRVLNFGEANTIKFDNLNEVYEKVLEVLGKIFKNFEGFGHISSKSNYWTLEDGADAQIIVVKYEKDMLNKKISIMSPNGTEYSETNVEPTDEIPYQYFFIDNPEMGRWELFSDNEMTIYVYTRYKDYLELYTTQDVDVDNLFKNLRPFGEDFTFSIRIKLKDNIQISNEELVCNDSKVKIKKNNDNGWDITVPKENANEIIADFTVNDSKGKPIQKSVTIPEVVPITLSENGSDMLKSSSLTPTDYQIISLDMLFEDVEKRGIKIIGANGNGIEHDDYNVYLPEDKKGMLKVSIIVEDSVGLTSNVALNFLYKTPPSEKSNKLIYLVILSVVIIVIIIIIKKSNKKR